MSRYAIGFWILTGWFVVFRMFPSTPEDFDVADAPIIQADCGYSISDPGPVEGKIAFQTNCASCHCDPNHGRCEQSLAKVQTRIPPGNWIYDWIHDSQALIRSGDAYANKIWRENGKALQPPFPDLDNHTIDLIMEWIGK
jgi:hypothetical protein